MNDMDKTREELLEELRILREQADFKLKEALIESQRFREALDQVSSYIYMKDTQSRYVYANRLTLELFGCSAGEVIGSDDTRFFPPETVKQLREIDLRVLSGEQTKEEIDVTDAKGVRRVYWEVKSPIYTEPGSTTIWGLLGISTDITERKQFEEALLESEEKYRILTESMKDVVWTLDPESLRFLYVSPSVEKLRGYTPEEIIADSMDAAMKPEMATFLKDLIRHRVEEFKASNNSPIPFYTNELEQPCKNGTFVWTEVVSGYYLNEKTGRVEVRAVTRDITERKMAEKELLESETRFRTIIDSSPVPMALNDKQQQITFLNPAFVQLFGYTLDDIPTLAHWWPKAYPDPDYRQWVADTWNEKIVLAEQTNTAFIPMEVSLRCKDGTNKIVLVSATPFSGPLTGIHLVVFYDITDRKQVEAELMKSEAELRNLNAKKDKFFSIIAHDLRSPFNSFLGLTETISEEMQDMTLDEIQKMTASMHKSASSLFRLLENLLEWSKMQQDLTGFVPERVSVASLVSDSIEIYAEQSRQKQIEIETRVPEFLEVLVDIRMIETTLRNLVSNALKFNHKNGRICISARPAENNTVEIAVKDTGIGMSPGMVRDLFRLEANIRRKGTEGETSSGLGLILCKEFIEKHGGKIWAESEEGKGSAFYFTLPVRQ